MLPIITMMLAQYLENTAFFRIFAAVYDKDSDYRRRCGRILPGRLPEGDDAGDGRHHLRERQ